MHNSERPRQRLEEAFVEFFEDQRYKGNSPATLHFYRGTLRRFLDSV